MAKIHSPFKKKKDKKASGQPTVVSNSTTKKGSVNAGNTDSHVLESSTNHRLEEAYLKAQKENTEILVRMKELEEFALEQKKQEIAGMNELNSEPSALKWAQQVVISQDVNYDDNMNDKTVITSNRKKKDNSQEEKKEEENRKENIVTGRKKTDASILASQGDAVITGPKEITTTKGLLFRTCRLVFLIYVLFYFRNEIKLSKLQNLQIHSYVTQIQNKWSDSLFVSQNHWQDTLNDVLKKQSDWMKSTWSRLDQRFQNQILKLQGLDWDSVILPLALENSLEGKNVAIVSFDNNNQWISSSLSELFMTRLNASSVVTLDTNTVNWMDLTSVSQACDSLLLLNSVDALILFQGGFMWNHPSQTEQELEYYWGVNYLSQFLLTQKVAGKGPTLIVPVRSFVQDILVRQGQRQGFSDPEVIKSSSFGIPTVLKRLKISKQAYSNSLLASSRYYNYLCARKDIDCRKAVVSSNMAWPQKYSATSLVHQLLASKAETVEDNEYWTKDAQLALYYASQEAVSSYYSTSYLGSLNSRLRSVVRSDALKEKEAEEKSVLSYFYKTSVVAATATVLSYSLWMRRE